MEGTLFSRIPLELDDIDRNNSSFTVGDITNADHTYFYVIIIVSKEILVALLPLLNSKVAIFLKKTELCL